MTRIVHHAPFVGALFLAAALSLWLGTQQSDRPFELDDYENFKMGYNLYRHGVISAQDGERLNPRPTDRREPLLAVTFALYLRVVPGFTEYPSPAQALPQNITIVKRFNLIWVFAVLVAAWLLSRRLTGSIAIAFLVLVSVFYFLCLSKPNYNSFSPDLLAATLLTSLSLALVVAFERRTVGAFAIAGLVLGLVCLTKAPFLYISAGIVPTLGVMLLVSCHEGRSRPWTCLAAFTLAACVVVAPWMIRNYRYFGDFELSQRAGEVLLVRAYIDQMTREELVGAFYAYSPTPVRAWLEPVTGLTARDLALGGRLQRLVRFQPGDDVAVASGDPKAAVSFYARMVANINVLRRQCLAAGVVDSDRCVGLGLKEKAIALIDANLLRHVLVSVPLMWRGIWCFDHLNSSFAALANFLGFVMVLAMPVAAAVKRRADLFLFVLPTLGSIAFHALITHYIGRYSVPTVPILVTSLFLSAQVAAAMMSKLWPSTSRPQSAEFHSPGDQRCDGQRDAIARDSSVHDSGHLARERS